MGGSTAPPRPRVGRSRLGFDGSSQESATPDMNAVAQTGLELIEERD